MSQAIEFKVIEAESTFLHPRKGFEPEKVRFEVRIDPLTGKTGHYSHFGAIKAQRLDLEHYSKPEIMGFCPFCLDKRDKVTPKFTTDIYPEGRPSLGEAMLIPNLFPYDIYSGVVIMADDHVVSLEQLNGKRLQDAFTLGISFLGKIKTLSPSIPYHLMTWNYMPPSGGGLVHPHQQYFATQYPGNQFIDELRASEGFYRTHGKDYWSILIDGERNAGQRYVGNVGASHWLIPFVCLGILGDVMCVFPDVYSIEDFKDRHIDDLVAGLSRVFEYYRSEGIMSFNASLLFGPEGQRYFPCHLRISARTFLNMRDFAPDLNFFQAILGEPVCVAMPEDLCKDVGKFF
jgi:UDPglucose--hexose-1-phosphate uridylyltransferase